MADDITRVLGNIYISSIAPINDGVGLFKKFGISHVVSAVTGDVPAKYKAAPYTSLQVPILDAAESNLLEWIDRVNAFMDNGLYGECISRGEGKSRKHSGSVLVHCAQGSSRSVCLVAAYLMHCYGLNSDMAIHAINRKREVYPAGWFTSQLKVYEQYLDSGNEVPLVDSDAYKEWFKKFKYEEEEEVPEGPECELRCKRCRQKLAQSSSFIRHSPPEAGSSQSVFNSYNRWGYVVKSEEAAHECTHYFMETLNWMKPELERGDMEGKFACPKCQAKVGGYNWTGTRCSCGKWMNPAIHLQSAKVDRIIKGN